MSERPGAGGKRADAAATLIPRGKEQARSTLPEYGANGQADAAPAQEAASAAPPAPAPALGVAGLHAAMPLPEAGAQVARTATPGAGQPAVVGLAALPQPGDVIAQRYVIEDELGRGAMGVVYAATQRGTDKRVALKWLFELGGARQEERRRRFLREARAASAISHPNVVKVYDAGEHEGGVFLVMERLEGESLRQRMLRGTTPVADAIDLLMPALRGIDVAHKHGVVHRDLKPENLLVIARRRDGALRSELKVVDFGLSKLVGAAEDSLETVPGAMIGTPQYMSPEQAAGRADIDARTDVYSLGVILYELIAGQRPFVALSLAALLLKLAREDAPMLHTVAPSVPLAFSKALARALDREPSKRYASVEELARAIEPFGRVAFQSGAAVRAHDATSVPEDDEELPSVSAFTRRSSRVRMAIGAVVALVLLGLGWMIGTREEAAAPPSAAGSAPAHAASATAAVHSAPAPEPEPLPVGVSIPAQLPEALPARAANVAAPRAPQTARAAAPARKPAQRTRASALDRVQPLAPSAPPAQASEAQPKRSAGLVDPWD